MTVIRVGVQAPPVGAGQLVDIDASAAIIGSIANAGADAVQYSADSGATWATVSGGATVAASLPVTQQSFRLRRSVAGGYPAPVDVEVIAPIEASGPLDGAQFGILPTNADNAPGFALFAAWLMAAGVADFEIGRTVTLELGPGNYRVSGAVLDLTWRGTGFTYTPQFTIRGAGSGVTRIISTDDSTSPVLFQVLAGYVAHSAFEDLQFAARPDVRQDALSIVATRRTLDNTGGITLCRFRRVGIRSERGDGLVLVGGSDTTLAPNQFLEFDECSMYADRGVGVKVLGQFGQVRFAGGSYGTQDKNLAASASLQFGPDRRFADNPVAVDATDDWVTITAPLATGTPVRFIGKDLPGGVGTGTTYYVRHFNPASDTVGTKYTLHTSQANVASNTRVNLTGAGSPANWRVAPLYVTSVESSVLNFEFPHNLPEQKQVQIVGENLPTGLATATTYWVIRRSATQIALASSEANAIAGTAVTFSGGTVTAFALTVPDSAVGAYTVHLDGASVEGCLQAIYADRSGPIVARLHCEENKQTFFVNQSRLHIVGGLYANAADDGGAGVLIAGYGLLSTVSVDAAPYTNGTIDKLLNVSGGAAYRCGVSWVREGNSSTTHPTTQGIARQIGVEAGGSVIVDGHDFVFVNTSATTIQNISSRHAAGARLRLMAWSGSIVLGSSGNIRLPAASSTLTVPEKGVVTLELLDTVGTWVLVGRSF